MLVDNVPSVERAYGILELLLRHPFPLGISDLARRLNLNKSTVHSLVHTLKNLGLLQSVGLTGMQYGPSSSLAELWRVRLLSGPLARIARPFLTEFSERQGLTTLAGVYFSGNVLVVDAVLAPGFSVSAYPGQMLPIWAGALGKLLLASLETEEAAMMIKKKARQSPPDVRYSVQEIDSIRKSGVALDREEYLEGLSALAALTPNLTGGPLQAVWCVGLAPSLPEERLKALSLEIKTLADRVGRHLSEIETLDDSNQIQRRLSGDVGR